MVTTSGAPSGTARVQDPLNSNRTVSEGIGYGLLAAVYMSDQTTFNELWGYEKQHLDGNGLMNWEIDDEGNTEGTGSATDADEDMAWALLMADKQWPGNGYAAAGQTIAGKLSGEFDQGVPNIGDQDANSSTIHPDYFAPAYYTLFGLTSDITPGYNLLGALTATTTGNTTGLIPDSSGITSGNGTVSFGFEASRAPLRVGLHYCFTGSDQAKGILTPMAAFFVKVGVTSLEIPINIDTGGADGTQDPAAAVMGPAAIAAMVSSGNQAFIDAAWTQTYSLTLPSRNGNNYFDTSLGVLSLLVLSGNFIDYTSL
ncbi:MAG TPA: glycosyl hydrolase family 8 [Polyangiaceae bacterium]|nr:glycosyl hydrolase family 8 [Polyangiaceae bacterium]